LNTTDQSHSLFQTRLISLKISCSTIVALNTITWQHETQNVKTHNSTTQKLKRWATRTTPTNPGMNSCASYKTPTVLFIYTVKSGKSLVIDSDRGNKTST
jgi:hypothetical protein